MTLSWIILTLLIVNSYFQIKIRRIQNELNNDFLKRIEALETCPCQSSQYTASR